MQNKNFGCLGPSFFSKRGREHSRIQIICQILPRKENAPSQLWRSDRFSRKSSRDYAARPPTAHCMTGRQATARWPNWTSRKLAACSMGSRGGPVLLPIEDPVQKYFTADEYCAASATSAEQLGRHVCGNDGQRARRRSLCSRCTPLVSKPCMPASSHASEHGMLMLTCARACALADVR